MCFSDEVKKRFIRLSRGQRKVAQFIIENPNVVATHIASEVGKIIGVSESTVIRFCYAMDLSGYGELQEKIKEDLSNPKKSSMNQTNVPIGKNHDYLFNKVMNRDVTSILNTIQRIDAESFQKAALFLHEADRIYTLGFRHCAPSTSYLSVLLENFGKKVEKIECNVEGIVQQIKKMNKHSLLFVIALDSILEDILSIVKIAKNKQVKIIAITNSTISPVRDYADISFVAGSQKLNAPEVNTAANSLTHALVEGMILHNRNHYQNSMKSDAQLDSELSLLYQAVLK